MTDRRLRLNIVADRFGVSVETVRRWIRAGKLAAERTPGGQLRVTESALEALRKENHYKPQQT